MDTLVSKAYIVVPVCLVPAGTCFDDGVSWRQGAGDGGFPDGVLAARLRVGGGGGGLFPMQNFDWLTTGGAPNGCSRIS